LASLAVLRGDLNKAVRFFQIALEANREDLDAALNWAMPGSAAESFFKRAVSSLMSSSRPGLPKIHVLKARGSMTGVICCRGR
jgi:hypothetical protein